MNDGTEERAAPTKGELRGRAAAIRSELDALEGLVDATRKWRNALAHAGVGAEVDGLVAETCRGVLTALERVEALAVPEPR